MPVKKQSVVEKVLKLLPASIVAIEGASKAKGARKKIEAITGIPRTAWLKPVEREAAGLDGDEKSDGEAA